MPTVATQPKTTMRAFGTSSRIGHDSNQFYNRAMYAKATPVQSKRTNK